MAVAGAALAVWAFWIEPASLRAESYQLALADWPSECSPLRVAVLADLHVGSPFNFVSPGLGTSIVPVRFLVPPEVSLLVISGHGTAR